MKKPLLLLFLLVFCVNVFAQEARLFFDRIDTKAGLPESSVRNIVEDAGGYLWFSTQNGLVRYDGYRCKVYNLGSARLNRHPITMVISLCLAADKTLWASTYGNGLFSYDPTTDSFKQYVYPTKTLAQTAWSLVPDDDGTLWGGLADSTASLMHFWPRTGKYDVYSYRSRGVYKVNFRKLIGIVKDDAGTVWIETDNGLYKYDGQDKPLKGYLNTADPAKGLGVDPVYRSASQPNILWMNTYPIGTTEAGLSALDLNTGKVVRRYRPSVALDSLHNALINGYHEDKSGRLWLATANGIAMLDPKTNKFANYQLPDTSVNFLRDLKVSNDGKFWLTAQGGLVQFDPSRGKFNIYKPEPGEQGALTSNAISTKILDRTGNLWIGFYKGGVSKIGRVKSAFEIIRPSSAGVFAGRGGTLLSSTNERTEVQTGNGIYNWQPASKQFNIIVRAGETDYLNDAVQHDDVYYMATDDGLIVYDKHSGKRDTYRAHTGDNTGLTGNVIERVFRDHTGLVWLAINGGGVCTFDPLTRKITRLPYQDGVNRSTALNDGSLDDKRAIAFYEDMHNTLWVGTNNGSLNKYDRATGRFLSYRNAQNFAMTCVDEIYEDRSGRLWIGTYQNGLFEFDRKKGRYTRHFTESNGLLYNSITTLKEDAFGRLWISGDRGLSRLDPKTNVIRNFKVDDILPGEDIVSMSKVAFNDGRFVVGIKGGLALFDPAGIDDDPNPPMVHLETIRYNKPGGNDSTAKTLITYGRKQIDLAYDQNSLQFSFIGLHYEDPASNTYAYMLEGFDKQWVFAGTNRIANYNNLPAGTYTFKVKSANSSGVWNEKGDSVIVVISPPWWLTWWAWILWAAVFITLVYIYIRHRSKHLIYENQLLEERVEERTNQLTEANRELNEKQEEITAQRDQLEDTVKELKATQEQLIQSEKLASLGELTAGIAHEIQNPLNFINNFSEVSIELAGEMKEELRAGSKKEAIAIANDIELNLEKIVQHGRRADGIVKNMLQHSRTGGGQKAPTDINALADEYLKLSYHGLRARDKDFNAEMIVDLDSDLPKLSAVSQDIGRVLLNLFNNAFYAVHQRKKTDGVDYKPVIEVSTRVFTPPKGTSEVRIYVKDNGTGIPDAVKEKVMQPFFTTKPTGEGTGLGLSLSHDIIVKGHGGKMEMASKEGEYTEFIIKLPIK